jgi:hypothetical protein
MVTLMKELRERCDRLPQTPPCEPAPGLRAGRTAGPQEGSLPDTADAAGVHVVSVDDGVPNLRVQGELGTHCQRTLARDTQAGGDLLDRDPLPGTAIKGDQDAGLEGVFVH